MLIRREEQAMTVVDDILQPLTTTPQPPLTTTPQPPVTTTKPLPETTNEPLPETTTEPLHETTTEPLPETTTEPLPINDELENPSAKLTDENPLNKKLDIHVGNYLKNLDKTLTNKITLSNSDVIYTNGKINQNTSPSLLFSGFQSTEITQVSNFEYPYSRVLKSFSTNYKPNVVVDEYYIKNPSFSNNNNIISNSYWNNSGWEVYTSSNYGGTFSKPWSVFRKSSTKAPGWISSNSFGSKKSDFLVIKYPEPIKVSSMNVSLHDWALNQSYKVLGSNDNTNWKVLPYSKVSKSRKHHNLSFPSLPKFQFIKFKATGDNKVGLDRWEIFNSSNKNTVSNFTEEPVSVHNSYSTTNVNPFLIVYQFNSPKIINYLLIGNEFHSTKDIEFDSLSVDIYSTDFIHLATYTKSNLPNASKLTFLIQFPTPISNSTYVLVKASCKTGIPYIKSLGIYGSVQSSQITNNVTLTNAINSDSTINMQNVEQEDDSVNILVDNSNKLSDTVKVKDELNDKVDRTINTDNFDVTESILNEKNFPKPVKIQRDYGFVDDDIHQLKFTTTIKPHPRLFPLDYNDPRTPCSLEPLRPANYFGNTIKNTQRYDISSLKRLPNNKNSRVDKIESSNPEEVVLAVQQDQLSNRLYPNDKDSVVNDATDATDATNPAVVQQSIQQGGEGSTLSNQQSQTKEEEGEDNKNNVIQQSIQQVGNNSTASSVQSSSGNNSSTTTQQSTQQAGNNSNVSLTQSVSNSEPEPEPKKKKGFLSGIRGKIGI